MFCVKKYLESILLLRPESKVVWEAFELKVLQKYSYFSARSPKLLHPYILSSFRANKTFLLFVNAECKVAEK